MNLGYIIIGCIFLLNPYIGIIDILPDVIGYLFLLKGLYQISDLDRNLAQARMKFRVAAWVSVVKFFLMFLSPFMDETFQLVLTFSFGTLELIYLIPAFIGFFTGISYLELRHTNHRTRRRASAKPRFGGLFDKTEFAEGTAYFEVYEDPCDYRNICFHREAVSFEQGNATVCLSDAGFSSRHKKSGIRYLFPSDQMQTLTIVFLIVRTLCACLPEFTSLIGTGGGYVEANPRFDASLLRDVLVILFFAVGLVFGLLWIIRMAGYMAEVRRDREFIAALDRSYSSEILPNEPLWLKRRMTSFCSLCTASFAFFMCIKLDWFYFVPEFAFGIVMLVALRSAGPYAEHRRSFSTKVWLFIVFQTAAYAVLLTYAGRLWYTTYGGYYTGSLIDPALVNPFRNTAFLPLFEAYAVLLIASFVMFLLISKEKKQVYHRLTEEITSLSCPAEFERQNRRRVDVLNELSAKIDRYARLETAYAVCSVICMIGGFFADVSELFALTWSLRILFGIFLMVKSASLSKALQDEMDRAIM